MSFRFTKRIKVVPGVTLNLSKSGISATVGPKGARLNVGSKRGPRVTTSIPGTGMSFTRSLGAGQRLPRLDQPRPRRPSRVFLLLFVLLLSIGFFLLVTAKFGR